MVPKLGSSSSENLAHLRSAVLKGLGRAHLWKSSDIMSPPKILNPSAATTSPAASRLSQLSYHLSSSSHSNSTSTTSSSTSSDNSNKHSKMSSQPEHPTLLIPGPIEFDDAVLQSMSHYRYEFNPQKQICTAKLMPIVLLQHAARAMLARLLSMFLAKP